MLSTSTKKADAVAPTQTQTKYSIAEQIMQRLKQGQATRAELVSITGIGDRTLRSLIKLLRNAGMPIINMSDNKGYKLAETEEELERYKMQEYARANSIIRSCNAMHIDNELQMNMFM